LCNRKTLSNAAPNLPRGRLGEGGRLFMEIFALKWADPLGVPLASRD
jgi:hypothetical protein